MGFLLRDFKAGIAVVSRIDPGKGRMTMRVRYERSTSNTRIKTMPIPTEEPLVLQFITGMAVWNVSLDLLFIPFAMNMGSNGREQTHME